MPEQKPGKLIHLLEQELNDLGSLRSVLSKEKEALIARDYESLEELANQKQQLSEQLEQSSKERIALLHIEHSNHSKSVMEAFLSHCSVEEAQRINQLNAQLAEQLTMCREANTVNGQVIATNINVRQEFIAALSGQNGESHSVYTAAGEVKTSNETGKHQEA